MCALCVSFFVVLSAVTTVIIWTKDSIKESVEDGTLSADVLMAALDDKKLQQLANGEWQWFNGEQYALRKQYLPAHKAYTNAVDQFSKALGAQARMTSVMIGIQARFEYKFHKYQLAEKLFKEELAILQKQKMRMKSIFYVQEWLVGTFDAEGMFEDAEKMAVSATETAKQIDAENHSQSHEMFFDALEHEFLHLRPNRDAERLYEEGLILARQMPDRKTTLAKRLDDVAWCRCMNGDFRSAADLDSEAIALSPTVTRYWCRADAYSLLKLSTPAINDYTTALQMHPHKVAELLTDRAKEYERTGNHEAALADYKRAIELQFTPAVQKLKGIAPNDSPYPSPYMGRGDLHLHMKNYRLAVADYTEAVDYLGLAKRKPYDAGEVSLLENRAKAYAAMGETKLATQDKQKASEVDTQTH